MSNAITVTIAATQGSTPREVGARMLVFADHIKGSIGGGSLEWAAMATARAMLAAGKSAYEEDITLGPDMGQCCGGRVRLTYAAGQLGSQPTRPAIFIWGAGHVGRAIAAVIAPFEAEQVTLVDISAERLPDPMMPRVQPLVAADPVLAVPHLPTDGRHFILTHSHPLDLALCDALLRHGFFECGLIGSKTKWARFQSRLAQMGHEKDQISRIACPIGDPSLGKHPQAIAVGVATRLLLSA